MIVRCRISHHCFGMTVRQSPVWASQTRICPARQQLASSIPSLARHSMSCRTEKHNMAANKGKKRGFFAFFFYRMPCISSHHTVASQQEGGDLADRRRITVVIAWQVSTPPASVSGAVLAIVTGAQNPVETEEQKNQQNPCSQAQSCHPEENENRVLRGRISANTLNNNNNILWEEMNLPKSSALVLSHKSL